MGADGFKYWAFLSYSHGDEAFAVKLHRALEQYSLPLNVRRAHSLPRRLIPIFRDVDELSAAHHLNETLQRALDESRWLIVICSPRSAASRYVSEEVDYFVKRHGADHVLCVLADGEPPECFPPAIRNLGVEPLAADCRQGKDLEAAKLKLISAMAVVGYTELRNRETQRRKRTRIAIATAATIAVTAALAYWDLFVRTHVDDYANYVRVNGIWQGVDPISPESAERRAASYRFTRHGRLHPPERVEYFHGCTSQEKSGMADIADSPAYKEGDIFGRALCRAEFVYHGDGTIASESMLNRYDVPILTLTYTTPTLAQFTLGGFASANSAGGMRYVKLERDDRGRDRSTRFFYAEDMPRANDRKHFGYRFDYDEAGHVLTRSVLDDTGAETGEITRYRYDDAGSVLEESYVDNTGRPRTNRNGYATIRFGRDADGNEIDESYYDEAGQPATDGDLGIHRETYVFDGHGNFIQQRYLDTRDKPMVATDGLAGVDDRYDTRGRMVRRDFLGLDGKAVANVRGEFGVERDYDEHGSVIEERSLGVDGKPAPNEMNFAIIRNEYDSYGRVVMARFLDAQRRPAMTRYGAALGNSYNRRGDILSFEFYDADGKPFVRPDRKCARNDFTRDDNGVSLESVCLDADLKPRRSSALWTYKEFKHDDFGRIVEWRMLDADRKPMRIADGYAIERARFDRASNRIEDRYFDTDDSPIAIPLEGFGWTAQYDHQGRVTVKSFLDHDGKPAELDRGYASVRYTYGIGDRELAESYLDRNGNAITGHRLAASSLHYDAHGRQVEQRYLDGDGALIAGPLAFASLKTEYDESGRLVAERCLDAEGHPVDREDSRWATHEVSYGADGLKNRYLNAAGAEVTPAM